MKNDSFNNFKMKHLLLIITFQLFQIPLFGQIKLSIDQEAQIKTLIQQMSLKEKTSLLHANSKFYVGGIDRLGIPELALSDGPHGVRAEINRHDWYYAGRTDDFSTCFPPGTSLAASWNKGLAYQRGLILGEEARARKKDILLGPGVNIIRTPLCGRNFEYMSEDPLLTSEMAVPYIRAIQTKDVAASVKHWLANNQEANRTKVNVNMSERALREIYLPAFKAAIEEAGVYTVMAAYNKFRGDWCSENVYLNQTILRDELHFNGVLMTDWDAAHSTNKAANSGLDLEMGTTKEKYEDWYFANPLIKAVEKGEIPMSLIDKKVANILRVMFKLRMFTPKARINGKMNTIEHQKAAYQSAAEAIVLLKNNNKILPLDNKIKSIALIGDNVKRKHCGGGLSSEIKTLYEITPYDAFSKKYKGNINYALGYEKTSTFVEGNNIGQKTADNYSQKYIDEAVEAAKKSETVIIFGGLNHDFDSESFDKLNMKLPYAQELLVEKIAEVNSNIVFVVVAGSPVDLSGIKDQVKAIVWAGYGGMEAGNAVYDALFGKINPSGKMPFTIPVKLEDSPAHHLKSYSEENLESNYEEDILVGYRWFDTKKITPLYAFGHGLSYTSFAFDNYKTDCKVYQSTDSVRLTLKVKNTGAYDGAEVVQIYIGKKNSKVIRAQKELRAFEKIFLKKNQSKEIEFNLPIQKWAYFNESSKKWIVEKGVYEIMIGKSSDQIIHTIKIEVL